MKEALRLAAVGDIHYARTSQGTLQSLLINITNNADILLLCGDIVDYGLPEEAQLFCKDLVATVKIPTLAVLGNHEYESDKQGEVQHIFTDAGIRTLDGEACEIQGLGFAGVKGFAGGFGERALQAWGEESIKRFVHEAVNEALKLESALAKLRTTQRIAVLHYSPLQETVEGEPPEIFPFLGSSRLEEPLNRYPVTAVFHGHAHRGRLKGQTKGGIPVYNVAMPLLQQAFPGRPPFRLLEIPLAGGPASSPPTSSLL
jgi:Icc-related predicted phosphoesterase